MQMGLQASRRGHRLGEDVRMDQTKAGKTSKRRVAVIGTGRVGLPLALTLRERGHEVTGIDIDATLRAEITAGRMPFHEPGCQELLNRYGLPMHDDLASVADADEIVITVGTPLHSHIEVDLSQVERVIEALLTHLRVGHHLVLRSTVAPRTTEYVRRIIHQKTPWRVGRDIALSFCPERLAEGVALRELQAIPQICGTEDTMSANRAAALFGDIAPELFFCDYVSAELSKLFCNIYRYINFAIANQFALIADGYGADVHHILRMANHRYPRGPIPGPGFTAGTCLRKDFGMINEAVPYPDLLLGAWKINEFMPNFLVQHIQRRIPLQGQHVAVLGYAFKKNTDDVRDSLVPKLLRYLRRENPASIRVSDPHLDEGGIEGQRNVQPEEAVRGAQVIFVATNHTCFQRELGRLAALAAPEAWIADLWNVGNVGRIFYRAALISEATIDEQWQPRAA
jgi:UDP-N-acetyl-D-mannosaminuronic acid dehydrogenase